LIKNSANLNEPVDYPCPVYLYAIKAINSEEFVFIWAELLSRVVFFDSFWIYCWWIFII